MQEFFGDRRISCAIAGKNNELMVFKHAGRTSRSVFIENFIFKVLLDDTTALSNGDLVTDPEANSYFVIARRDGAFTKTAQLQKVNGEITVQKLSVHYTNKTKDGYCVTQSTVVPTSYKEITGKMQQFDQGLLPTTTIQFTTQSTDVTLTDRIVLGNANYIVNYIDVSKYPGLYVIQCSLDQRVIR